MIMPEIFFILLNTLYLLLRTLKQNGSPKKKDVKIILPEDSNISKINLTEGHKIDIITFYDCTIC